MLGVGDVEKISRDPLSGSRASEGFWCWRTSSGLCSQCYSLICVYPLEPFGDHGIPGVGGKCSPNQVRNKSLLFCTLWILHAVWLERKDKPWSSQAFATLSVARSSIRSQLLCICYFWSILAFIWRKVTGKHSVLTENLLVITVTVYCWNNYCLHCAASWKLAFWCESARKSDAPLPHTRTRTLYLKTWGITRVSGVVNTHTELFK